MMKQKKYLFFLFIPFSIMLFLKSPDVDSTLTYISNPDLETVISHPDWKGTPVDEKGNFTNLYHPFESSLWDLMKWKLSANPQQDEKENDNRQLTVEFDPSIFEGTEDYLIWLGHASYLMRINGYTILTDPVLIDNFFLKRKSALPFPIENLPDLDFILVSHGHRDHCDKKTIAVLSILHPKTTFLVGLGMKDLLTGWIDGQEIQEAGWFQKYELGDRDIQITYLPSRHWSRRGLFDENEILWGGYFINAGEKTVYFMGDSGYGKHFQDIKNVMGEPEYCIMGVGAYKPEWFMAQAHISPKDAIKAHNELGGKYFIPMHYGTFDLSDEPILEPIDVLLENENRINGHLINPIIGQNLFRNKGQ